MRKHVAGWALACTLALSPLAAQAANFTLEQALGFPYVSGLTSAEHAGRVAWVRDVGGVRNVWVADGPTFKARPLTQYRADDGQEISGLTFSPDGAHFVFVRGGDHDENWPAEGNLAPDPDFSNDEPKVTIWSVSPRGGAPVKMAEGDEPALSSGGVLAYVTNDQVWTVAGKGKPERLFFDRGKDHDLHWSPDGKRLAFVSDRGDHSFIGVYSGKGTPLLYLAPSTNKDFSPRWSADGKRIAFVRAQGDGGPPVPLLTQTPNPWSIWVADAASGEGHVVWQSPNTMPGTLPDTQGGVNLTWAAGDKLVFLATLDRWEHLYSVPASGGAPLLLTPGAFMIEYATVSRDGKSMLYTANTGNHADDGERRHVFRVPVDQAKPVAITFGDTVEWQPVAADDNHVAFISSGATRPMAATIATIDGSGKRDLDIDAVQPGYPSLQFVVPKAVSFKAADGTLVHGDLFQHDGGGAKPGVIFVHGGPPRQMLLGWHPMDYYDNAYAMNQYLAAHGFTVLSVNYRLGIGYGQAFYRPDHAGPAGAAEYQDVVAGAHFLQQVKGVDGARIGIWGGSYGGYLTGLALARNSDIFKAGVDFHGVHDWSAYPDGGKPNSRYEKGDRDAAMKVAFQSSPDADIAHWRSPVLLIHGDDDRNVPFNQTVDLARRLQDHHVRFEELIIPNEIHGFLRTASWLKADQATVDFLIRELRAKP